MEKKTAKMKKRMKEKMETENRVKSLKWRPGKEMEEAPINY